MGSRATIRVELKVPYSWDLPDYTVHTDDPTIRTVIEECIDECLDEVRLHNEKFRDQWSAYEWLLFLADVLGNKVPPIIPRWWVKVTDPEVGVLEMRMTHKVTKERSRPIPQVVNRFTHEDVI